MGVSVLFHLNVLLRMGKYEKHTHLINYYMHCISTPTQTAFQTAGSSRSYIFVYPVLFYGVLFENSKMFVELYDAINTRIPSDLEVQSIKCIHQNII